MIDQNQIKTSSMDPPDISYRTVSKTDIASSQAQIHSLPTEIPPSLAIDPKHQRFPYCIVWTPIPLITTLLPTIGHTGICTSDGIIHDFAGSYYVGIDNMAFGKPCKYILLHPNKSERDEWDKAIEKGDEIYNNETHNLCINNCHSHCAYVLNVLKYKGCSSYTMFHIWWMLIRKGKYISFKHVVKSYIGFVILVIVVMIMYCMLKS